MNVYTTIDELKQFLSGGLDMDTDEEDDPLLKSFCIEASRMFDTWVTNGVPPKRRFYPQLAVKNYDFEDATRLRLFDDLLEATTLTTENGAVSITASDYVLAAAKGDYDRTPYKYVILVENAAVSQFSYSGTIRKATALTGIWGYHDEWSDAWEDSGDSVQDDPLSDSATTITVNDVDGDDINGLPLRFKTQQLLRIEDEYLWITGTDATAGTDELTVRRGMNGSTAASHALDKAIEIFRPMADVRNALKALVQYLYKHRSSIGSDADRTVATADGILVLPSSLPTEVTKMLRPYRKEAL